MTASTRASTFNDAFIISLSNAYYTALQLSLRLIFGQDRRHPVREVKEHHEETGADNLRGIPSQGLVLKGRLLAEPLENLVDHGVSSQPLWGQSDYVGSVCALELARRSAARQELLSHTRKDTVVAPLGIGQD